MAAILARYLNPWKYRREQRAAQVAALRLRDGDCCARCRRELRFDLADGHDQGPAIEPLRIGAGDELDNLRLCHPRCNVPGIDVPGIDHSEEVMLRRRKANEVELFAKARKKAA